MKYKVGDKVKVRNGLKGGCRYGYTHFQYDMEMFCGKTLTIKEVSVFDVYGVLENNWWWTDEMFENPNKPEKFTSEVVFK